MALYGGRVAAVDQFEDRRDERHELQALGEDLGRDATTLAPLLSPTGSREAREACRTAQPPELPARGAGWCVVRAPDAGTRDCGLENRDLEPVRALEATALGGADAGAEVVDLGVAPAVEAVADASDVDAATQAAHVDRHDERLPTPTRAAGDAGADALEAGAQVRDAVPATHDQAPMGHALA